MNFLQVLLMKSSGWVAILFLSMSGMARVSAQEITSMTLTAEGEGIRASLEGTWETGRDYVIEDSADLLTWHQISPVIQATGNTWKWSHLQSSWWHFTSESLPFWWENHAETALGDRGRRWFYRVRLLPTADEAPLVIPTVPMGRLTQAAANAPLTYLSHNGWTIKIDQSTITVTDPTGIATYQHWGHPHENLNGKHVKDWLTTKRTMVLPGGVRLTMTADGPHGVVNAVSIYDVDQTHKIDTTDNSVTMSVPRVRVGEAAEPDGETMRFWHIGKGRYYAENIYLQETVGEGAEVRQIEVPLGTTGGTENPNQVNDYYDDPRLGHT